MAKDKKCKNSPILALIAVVESNRIDIIKNLLDSKNIDLRK